MQRSLTACENEVALVVVEGIKRKLHRLADDRDVASNFIVNSLVSEDLKSTHLKKFSRSPFIFYHIFTQKFKNNFPTL